jgi:hypothetical protein
MEVEVMDFSSEQGGTYTAVALEGNPSLSALARDALDSADGDVARATDIVVEKLLEDKLLLRSVIHEAIREASAYHVRRKMRSDREIIIRGAMLRAQDPVRSVAVPNGGGRNSVVALASVVRNSLLDMPLAGGLKLRHAKHEQVITQANLWESMSKDTGRKARWLMLIAKSVPPGKTVGEVITEDRAEALFREANNGHR